MIQEAIVAALQWLPLQALAVLAVLLASLLALRRLVGRPLTGPLRDRFVLGLPWGTLLAVAGLLVIYAVLQGGWENPHSPLVLPFRSWGYDYLLGTAASAFTHNGWGHLVNNVTATVAFAGVAEYAWGHYPRERGVQTFSTWATNPYARILVVPAAAAVVGLYTSLTGLGPLIGFSGVVFAFAGFAIVQRPLAGTLALVGVRILRLTISAVRNPEQVGSISPAVITPWWADVAIQTHGVGLVVGLLAGFALARHRAEWSNPLHVWFAVLVFAIAQGMWAVFLPRTGSSWLLLRWLGTALLFVMATLAAVLVVSSDRSILGRIDLHRRELAVGLLVVGLVTMSVAAIPFHVAPVAAEPAPNGVLEVGDYTVGYDENVPDGYVDAVSLPIGDVPAVPTSGVIVTSEQRNLWRMVISKQELTTQGRGSHLVGGLGWRERIYADWSGWRVAGNRSVYTVSLARETGEFQRAYASGPSRSGVVVDGYNLTLAPSLTNYTVTATQDDQTLGPVVIPQAGQNGTLGSITLVREEQQLVAVHEETRVPIATRTEQAG